ncbi:MAG: arylsulfatase [Sphaerochaeta sp.]|jgi:arylsulfatase A-like enzyme|uniref:sulfatase family protein n=1 Tax=Sphaerochaeta sp. TaxID=1972642 RepID=UPI003D12A918
MEQRKPNIVYILADDLGYGDVSSLNPGCPFATTHFGRLSREGMQCTDAHATSAVCTPSRYSIITGRYNWRSELKSSVLGGFSPPLIDAQRKTIAQMLKERGYSTHAVGKWHLGMELPKQDDFIEQPGFADSHTIDYSKPIKKGPVSVGFDTFYGISGSLDMPPYVYIKDDRFTSIPTKVTKGEGMGYWREGLTADDFIHEEVLDHLTDKAVEVIEKESDHPFFLYFALPAPHTPILPAKEFQGRSKTNDYGDFVLHCDSVVGRILSALDEVGLREDTLVVFTSDNGCSPSADFPALERAGHHPSYHFRGMKADIYEGGHRVPLLIRWPKVIEPGSTCDQLVSLCDFYATLAEYLGVDLAADEAVDSYSMLATLKSPSLPTRPSLVHQSIDGSLSLRRGPWKLEMCKGSGGWSFPVPGSKDEIQLPSLQLYNLEEDIREQVNVASAYPGIVQEMKGELRAIVEQGRSTAGPRQTNDGVAIWETVSWLQG